uniref:Translation initiation factor 5A C-terminal domain-containing protein n=1 Tax=Ananas comosus var. bracteatus TaxID=296719 RepID=A0A6V7NYS2_ANACO|nr:unnamed protein product [Ananas comosus var. bracteatus]
MQERERERGEIIPALSYSTLQSLVVSPKKLLSSFASSRFRINRIVGVRSSSSSSLFPVAQGEFWRQPDGMGYRLCLSFSDEYQGSRRRVAKKRDRKFAAWVGGSDSAVVEILDRSEISHPFSSNPIQVSYRYAAGRKTALLFWDNNDGTFSFGNDINRVSLLTENGNTKDDLRLPTDESLLMQIKDGFAEGKDLVVSVMFAMGEEQICSLKDIGPK